MSTGADLLAKVVRQREYLIKNKIGKVDGRMLGFITKTKNWLQIKPKDIGVKRYMRERLDDVLYIIPKNKSGDSLKTQILNFIES